MRVLRVITRLNIGGPSIQAIELTTRLGARGYRTCLAHGALGAGEGDMRYLLDAHPRDTYDLVEIPTMRRSIAPLDDVATAARLFALVGRFQPAIVHTHMAKAGTVGRLATLAYNRTVPRSRRARLVHTYHGHVLEGYFSRPAERVFLGIERTLARYTDRIIAISPHIRDELVDQHHIGRADQYRVVSLGFDLARLTAIDEAARHRAREMLGLDSAAHVVTTVGRMTAIKQHRLFLETARQVAERDPAAIFLIAGDGELRGELEQAARTLGVADRTRFLGWRRDLATIYGATDVFLLTSRNEGTPVALIESLAAGVPGVSTDVGGVRDVIDGDSVGLLAPFGDVKTLADEVCALVGDPARRRSMGARARAAMVAQYSLDRLLDDVDRLYRELLS